MLDPVSFERVIAQMQANGALGPGRTYCVNNSTVLQHMGITAANGNSGENWRAPLSTLDYAIGKCTSDRGDNILVGGGHAENIASAGAITMDKSGITIKGFGNGALIPTFTFITAAAADVEVDEEDCKIVGLKFVAGIDELVGMIDVDEANLTVEDCYFQLTGTSIQTIAAIVGAGAADGLTVRRCQFVGAGAAAAAGGTNAIVTAADDNVLIEDNHFFAAFTAAAGAFVNSAAASNLRVLRNTFINNTTGSSKCWQAHASTTGFRNGNYYGYLDGATTDPADCDGMHYGLDYYANDVATAATAI